MNFAREQPDVPTSDLTEIEQRTEFAPVKPLYRSTDRPRGEAREGNSLDITKLRSLAPPESDQHRLAERENSTPLDARKIPPIDPNTATRNVRPRVPFGLTPQAKSRLVRLSSARSNRIQLETKEFVNHLTEAGESLHLLSEKYYGTPDYYLDIYLANQDLLDNPARVPSGNDSENPALQIKGDSRPTVPFSTHFFSRFCHGNTSLFLTIMSSINVATSLNTILCLGLATKPVPVRSVL